MSGWRRYPPQQRAATLLPSAAEEKLQAVWDERDKRYMERRSYPAPNIPVPHPLTDEEASLVRAYREREAHAIRSVTMIGQARRWTPPDRIRDAAA